MSATRMTRQRTAILKALRKVTTHPTADELHGMVRQDMPHISLGTVYRNLDILTQTGEVLCLQHAGGQKRFDGDVSPHHHVRCTMCGKVGDVFLELEVPLPGPEQVPGFSVHGVTVEYSGLCQQCYGQRQ